MPTNLENFYREIVVFLGDVNRMEIRLSEMRKKARELCVNTEELASDFLESEKTIIRIKGEANELHDKTDDILQ